MPRLRRSCRDDPGLRRRRRGRGFEYVDEDGARVHDPEVVGRIAELAIPPAWEDVWICLDPLGHLQATGRDGAGRTQYLYHPRWRQRRDQEKFERMLEFARALPRLRDRVAEDLETDPASRDAVLACAVRLLDRGLFRIGGEDYAEDNGTYGLATIHRRHVSVSGDELTFSYEAKGGKVREQSIRDAAVVPIVRRLRRRRSDHPELLAYKRSGRWVDVRSADINDYVKEAAKGEFSAKDFRTWNATVIAAVALAGPEPESRAARRRTEREAVNGVAALLGNTPAVTRRSYIDPRLIDRFSDGETIRPTLRRLPAAVDPRDPEVQHRIERAVIRLLRD